MKKIILSGLFPEEICEKLNISQQFRGKQIFKWISKGISDFSQMTNLSSALREELSQKAEIFSSKIGKKRCCHGEKILTLRSFCDILYKKKEGENGDFL